MEKAGIAAVILAAGYSRRMGFFKPLLDLDGQPVIARIVDSFIEAGIRDIRAVVGFNKNRLIPVLETLGVRVIVNDSYADGMFTSVLAAAGSIEPGVKAFFLLPADMPLVRPHTLRYLIQCYANNQGKILIPCFMGKRGHPPLIDSRFIEKIAGYQGKDGLKGFFRQQVAGIIEVAVPDRDVLFDMDSPEDYKELQQRWKASSVPSVDECEVILKDLHKVSDSILRHSRAVAAVASSIADELNRSGSRIDSDLVIAAALLHDIARDRPGHAGESARIVRDYGYPEVARVIESHTDIILAQDQAVGAPEVLYLADKMVKEDKPVTLSERFGESVTRHTNQPEVMRKIKIRYNNALAIKDLIEARIGPISIDLQHDGNKFAGTRKWA